MCQYYLTIEESSSEHILVCDHNKIKAARENAYNQVLIKMRSLEGDPVVLQAIMNWLIDKDNISEALNQIYQDLRKFLRWYI